MAKGTILVAEDEPRIAGVLRAYLEQEGHQVVAAADGARALELFRRERPELVLLDLNLPEIDGLEVCRQIRRESSAPVIVLTARSDEADKLIGLELGADDYVTKPFSPREVVARVRAVLRRTSPSSPSEATIRIADLTLDSSRHEAWRGAETLDLTPTEFRILEVLMQNPGRVFSRLQLLDQIQSEAFEGYERTIDVHMKNLRKKVETDPSHPVHILTVYGVGYKFRE